MMMVELGEDNGIFQTTSKINCWYYCGNVYCVDCGFNVTANIIQIRE